MVQTLCLHWIQPLQTDLWPLVSWNNFDEWQSDKSYSLQFLISPSSLSSLSLELFLALCTRTKLCLFKYLERLCFKQVSDTRLQDKEVQLVRIVNLTEPPPKKKTDLFLTYLNLNMHLFCHIMVSWFRYTSRWCSLLFSCRRKMLL